MGVGLLWAGGAGVVALTLSRTSESKLTEMN